MTDDPSIQRKWRVGENYNIHVYEGAKSKTVKSIPICTAQSPEYAAQIVVDHNQALENAAQIERYNLEYEAIEDLCLRFMVKAQFVHDKNAHVLSRVKDELAKEALSIFCNLLKAREQKIQDELSSLRALYENLLAAYVYSEDSLFRARIALTLKRSELLNKFIEDSERKYAYEQKEDS